MMKTADRDGRLCLTQGDHHHHSHQRKPVRRVAERARPKMNHSRSRSVRGTAFTLWLRTLQMFSEQPRP
jgi:hypothetical protein